MQHHPRKADADDTPFLDLERRHANGFRAGGRHDAAALKSRARRGRRPRKSTWDEDDSRVDVSRERLLGIASRSRRRRAEARDAAQRGGPTKRAAPGPVGRLGFARSTAGPDAAPRSS